MIDSNTDSTLETSVDESNPTPDAVIVTEPTAEVDDGAVTTATTIDCKSLEIHPIANLYPVLGEEELAAFVKDIKANGLQDPITLYEGKVLDGHNRLLACQKLNITPKFEYYTNNDPVGFVLSKNEHRRHLNDDQRRAIAADLVAVYTEELKKSKKGTMKSLTAILRSKEGSLTKKAAKKMHVKLRRVQEAWAIKKKNPELHAQIKAGTLSIAKAKRIMAGPPPAVTNNVVVWKPDEVLLLVHGTEGVMANLLEAAQKCDATCQHQIIKGDNLEQPRAFFTERFFSALRSGDKSKQPGAIQPALVSPSEPESNREVMNGKPVLYRENAETVISVGNEEFKAKQLCDGLTLNTGDACVYACKYCYVPSIANKFVGETLEGRDHQKTVIRRRNAVTLLQNQLGGLCGQPILEDTDKPLVVFCSTLIDCCANDDLIQETAECCTLIFQLSQWNIRILTKSASLPKLVSLIPEEYHQRLLLGVSTGTLDDKLASAIESDAPLVSKRLESLRWLQDHKFHTYGMICPSLPQEDYIKFAKEMAEAIRVDKCEHVWAEVINIRGDSFSQTVTALDDNSYTAEADRLRNVFVADAETASPEEKIEKKKAWELYARATFEAHAQVIPPEKLRFLQYNQKGTEDYWNGKKSQGAVLVGQYSDSQNDSEEVTL